MAVFTTVNLQTEYHCCCFGDVKLKLVGVEMLLKWQQSLEQHVFLTKSLNNVIISTQAAVLCLIFRNGFCCEWEMTVS